MELEDIMKKRNKLDADANAQIQDSLEKMRAELSRSNEAVAQKVKKEEVKCEPETPLPQEVDTAKPTQSSGSGKPLIYFSYPMASYTEQPSWVDPLRQLLVPQGYLIYNPWDKISEQFGRQDLPNLNTLPLKVVKSLCAALYIPEEVLLPFETVWQLLQRGDGNDNYSIVFQCLWFLTRSSLVVCDLMRPMAGAGTAQELLYSCQLGIPVIGIFPTTGQLNPFAHRSTTALFSGTDLGQLLPLIRGYVPL